MSRRNREEFVTVARLVLRVDFVTAIARNLDSGNVGMARQLFHALITEPQRLWLDTVRHWYLSVDYKNTGGPAVVLKVRVVDLGASDENLTMAGLVFG